VHSGRDVFQVNAFDHCLYSAQETAIYDWNLCDPSTNTWLLLVQAYQASRRVAEAELRRHRITLGQFHILMLLASSKVALSPGEVASYLFREKNTISERLTRMEKAGYVKKSRSQEDERMVRVGITPEGKELLYQLLPRLVCSRRATAFFVSGEDNAQLNAFLKNVRDQSLQILGERLMPLPSTTFDLSELQTYLTGLRNDVQLDGSDGSAIE
jgi:DNA-binding MarR family transcriptional regulator